MSDDPASHYLLAATGPGQADAEVRLRVKSDAAHINLRGNPDDARLLAAAEGVLGQPLPTTANTFSDEGHRVCWMGPNEWHIITMTSGAELIAALDVQMAGLGAALNDVSGGYAYLELRGKGVTEVLAKGCTIDLHPKMFKPGSCAQTNLAKSAVLITRSSGENAFELLVRRSFAEYACLWLTHAARQWGWSLHVD